MCRRGDVWRAGDGGAVPLDPERLEREGHMGLAGMRERIGSLGGTVTLGRGSEGGLRVSIRLPLSPVEGR